MFLYANGCSWVGGNGIDSDPLLDKLDKPKSFYWNKYSWPARLAEIMNWNFINEGLGAGSNQRMVRMTTEFVKNWPTELLNKLIVILGWSSLERSEIFVSYNNVKHWCNFNMMQQFSSQWPIEHSPYPKHVLDDIDNCQNIHIKYMSDDDYFLSKFRQEIYSTSMLLEELNIKYIFFNSFVNYQYSYNIQEHITKFKFMSGPKFTNMLNYSMLDFCKDNHLPISTCHHPMIDGHYQWAKNLSTIYEGIYS